MTPTSYANDIPYRTETRTSSPNSVTDLRIYWKLRHDRTAMHEATTVSSGIIINHSYHGHRNLHGICRFATPDFSGKLQEVRRRPITDTGVAIAENTDVGSYENP
jgi:hypothetical protein